ncbi:MAG: hypothetical protein CME04_11710 [Gemmatimonadaceae bacterium]|jgi:DUF4097 and DUF4098 domain-containing protein YvlB|nr:hypothetical protein [Gemmatimonadaceae bacterium]
MLLIGTVMASADEARGSIQEKRGGWVERIDEVIDVKPGGTLSLDSDRGGITVDAEKRKGVRIIVEKTVDAYTEEEARLVFDRYSVDIARDGNDVEVITESEGRRTRSLQTSIRVVVPHNYNVDVETGGGGIDIGDLVGDVMARTSGGGISVGHIRDGSVDVHTSGGGIHIGSIENGDGEAKTSGGGISVGDVSGDLSVRTSGGGINIGKVAGDLEARTSGGGIQIGSGGTVEAQTGGGGIRVSGSTGAVVVHTSGGGITISDAGGPVTAETSGGGISVDGADGPVVAITSGGGLMIKDVRGSIEAETSGGGITAELAVADPGVDTHCNLETGGGDISIRLPADLHATIDAELQLRRPRREYSITTDFNLDIDENSRRIVARGDINGGGDTIRLRTTNGDIEIEKR